MRLSPRPHTPSSQSRTRAVALAISLALALGVGHAAATGQPPVSPASTEAGAHRVQVDVPAIRHPEGETPDWWFLAGAAQAAERGAMGGRAKNIILFVGDGMSLTTVAAARILDGQRRGAPGEENLLAWETFRHTAFSKTYNTDTQTPDSAGTMTAMASGVKTRAGVIGVDQVPQRGDCAGTRDARLLSLWQLAADAGLATGVVTTTRVTHATPAATFAHSADRNWENDADMLGVPGADACPDIARQFVETRHGRGPDVLMGGGRGSFFPVGVTDPEYDDQTGLRLDGRNLVAEWRKRRPDGAYIWNAKQLAETPAGAPLLALFEPGHMQYEHDRPQDRAGEPSLAEMTTDAIRRLQRISAAHGDRGFVLLVEGGRIDHAHHQGNAHRALVDTVALSDAVRAAVAATSVEGQPDDTLILVTADHSHTLTFAGYPARGNPILGKVRGSSGEGRNQGGYAGDGTGLPYTTLGYANGPGYTGATDQAPEGPKTYPQEVSGYQPALQGRPDLTDVDTEHPDYMQEATVPLSAETHGGEDVGVWAHGPGAHAVRGTIEQNALYHLMLQATPALRERLCRAGLCNADGVPVKRPPASAAGD